MFESLFALSSIMTFWKSFLKSFEIVLEIRWVVQVQRLDLSKQLNRGIGDIFKVPVHDNTLNYDPSSSGGSEASAPSCWKT